MKTSDKVGLGIVSFVVGMLIIYFNVMGACHEVIGIYKRLGIHSKLVSDMINYDIYYQDQLPDMTLEELKDMEKHRLGIEIKFLKNFQTVLEKIEN